MFAIARSWLTPPTLEDEEKRRIASLLHLMSLTLLAVSATTAVIALVFSHTRSALTLIIGSAGPIGALWLTRHARLKAASLLLLLVFLGVLTILLYNSDGFHDVAVLAYPVVIVMAAMLLNRRAFVLYALLTTLSLQIIIYGELSGYIVNELSAFTSPADMVYVVVIMLITAVSAHQLSNNITQSFAKARASQQALTKGNLELQREIAERKRVEEAYRALIEHSLQGLLILQDQRIVFANQTFASMSGYSVQELLAMSPTEVFAIVPPEDQALVRGHLQDRLYQADVLDRYECRGLRKDGTVSWVEMYASPIEYQGKPAIQMAVLDITGRRRAEGEREHLLAQIQEQARRVQQIVDTVPEGVLLLNTDGQIILANPVAEEELATLASVNVGDTLGHLGDRPLSELLTSPPKGLWHKVTADGRSLQVIARPIESGPRPDGWVLVIRDVSQQREIERRVQEQDRLAAVGQLAAGIAHDFNNIMATIVLYAQVAARSEELSTRDQERMAVINQQAQYATKLIQQILDFSRHAVLERHPMDLLALLTEQIELLERTLPENIEIDLSDNGGDHATPFTVHADPTRIQQVIMNLAVNARDAMPQGGKLRIELERLEIENSNQSPLPEMETGEWVRLRVSDTGAGIPPDVLPRIFEPFFTTKPAGEGTGLGLAQVWGIVKQHDGHIGVTTEVGKGTTFVIYLPALKVAGLEDAICERLTVTPGKGETILVVEDSTFVRESLVHALEALNYQVLTATNGGKALSVFEQHAEKVALVLTDMVMPEMGGVALSHALREKEWMGPVIMMTGHPLREKDYNRRPQTVAHWLRKPVDLKQLAEVVAQALSCQGIRSTTPEFIPADQQLPVDAWWSAQDQRSKGMKNR
jgi:two-component system cell cycle sensor histidine kinase/response regulator CckA